MVTEMLKGFRVSVEEVHRIPSSSSVRTCTARLLHVSYTLSVSLGKY